MAFNMAFSKSEIALKTLKSLIQSEYYILFTQTLHECNEIES